MSAIDPNDVDGWGSWEDSDLPDNPDEPSKGGKTKWVIIAMAALTVVVVFVSTWFMFFRGETPVSVAKSAIQSVKANNLDENDFSFNKAGCAEVWRSKDWKHYWRCAEGNLNLGNAYPQGDKTVINPNSIFDEDHLFSYSFATKDWSMLWYEGLETGNDPVSTEWEYQRYYRLVKLDTCDSWAMQCDTGEGDTVYLLTERDYNTLIGVFYSTTDLEKGTSGWFNPTVLEKLVDPKTYLTPQRLDVPREAGSYTEHYVGVLLQPLYKVDGEDEVLGTQHIYSYDEVKND